MSRRDLRAPHSIDELEAGDGATLFIGTQHDAAENSITQDFRDRYANPVALLLNREWHLRLVVKIERWKVTSRRGSSGAFSAKPSSHILLKSSGEIGRTAD